MNETISSDAVALKDKYQLVVKDINIRGMRRNWQNFLQHSAEEFIFTKGVVQFIKDCTTVNMHAQLLEKRLVKDTSSSFHYRVQAVMEEIKPQELLERIAQYKGWATRAWTVVGYSDGIVLYARRTWFSFFGKKLRIQERFPSSSPRIIYVLFTQEPAS